MQDIKLLSHQLDDKIYNLADESAPAVLARLSIRSHSGSTRLTRFGRCATQSESSAFQIQRDGDRSSTCAKPDALSAAANARARPQRAPQFTPLPHRVPPLPRCVPPCPRCMHPGLIHALPREFRVYSGPLRIARAPSSPRDLTWAWKCAPPWSVGPRFSACGSVCLRVVPFPPCRIT